MPIPGLLKSKAFWTFSTVTGSVSCCVFYDRFESHRLRQEYLATAAEYGRQPLPHHQPPRCLSVFLIAADATQHRAIRDTFRAFALDLLTVAGVDYKWAVEVDGEEAAKRWDELARDANKPESMLEAKITREELVEHVLKRKLSAGSSAGTEADELLWEGVRAKAAPVDSRSSAGSDGFLALDQYTLKELESSLKTITETPTQTVTAEQPKSKWHWFSKRSPVSPPPTPSLLPVNLYYIPCDYPQTLFARLNRFLYGQRLLTRSIGEQVLAVIREQPQTVIDK